MCVLKMNKNIPTIVVRGARSSLVWRAPTDV
jgi:hypothetical protein